MPFYRFKKTCTVYKKKNMVTINLTQNSGNNNILLPMPMPRIRTGGTYQAVIPMLSSTVSNPRPNATLLTTNVARPLDGVSLILYGSGHDRSECEGCVYLAKKYTALIHKRKGVRGKPPKHDHPLSHLPDVRDMASRYLIAQQQQ